MKRTPTIAEILHFAADHCLAKHAFAADSYSCLAVDSAVFHLACQLQIGHTEIRIKQGLAAMGCPVDSLHAFSSEERDGTSQQVRYAWLKFAALIAEEQGV